MLFAEIYFTPYKVTDYHYMKKSTLVQLFKQKERGSAEYHTVHMTLLIVGIIAIPLYGYLLKLQKPDVHDIMAERLMISAFGIITYLVYKAGKAARPYYHYLLYGTYYITTFWDIKVIAQNNFSAIYVVGHFLLITGIAIGIEKSRWRIYYGVVVLLLSSVALYLTPEHEINGYIFLLVTCLYILIIHLLMDVMQRMNQNVLLSSTIMHSIFDESSDALILLSRKDEKIVNCNQKTAELFRMDSSDELLGFSLSKFVTTKPDRPSTSKTFETSIADFSGMETKLYTHTGGEFWASFFVKDINVDHHQFHLVRIEDITDRKHQEEATRASEEWLRKIIENSNDGIMLLDSQFRILFCSKVFSKITGYTDTHFINAPFQSILFEDDSAQIEDALEKTMMLHQDIPSIQFKMAVQRGEFVWVEASFTNKLNDPVVRSIIINYRDISERRKITESLRESEDRYRSLFDNSPVGIVLFDKSLVVAASNERLAEIVGLEPGRLQYFNLRTLTNPKVKRVFENTLLGERGFIEGGYDAPISGKRIHVSLKTTPLYNKQGELTGGIGILEDISLRKMAENEIRSAKEKAEQSNRLKSAFLTNMSHELRTPMNGILGYAQILHEELGDNKLTEMANKIIRSGIRLMSTLNSILDLSLLESGEVKIVKKRIELGAFTALILKKFQTEAAERGLKLTQKGNKDLLYILADEKLLNQALSHLVDNALKFTEKGEVAISLDKEGNDTAVIKITDTGTGIGEENFELIFQDFRQESEGYNRHFEGVGVGLPIVRKILDLLGITIQIESKKGVGTVFYLRVPLQDSLPQNVAPPPEPEVPLRVTKESEAADYRVLLVEDNQMNVDLTVKFLKKYCSIDYEKDGASGVVACSQKQYDLILMDINLGFGINGVEAVEEIRKIEGYDSVPIVALTGYALKGDRELLLGKGFNYYLAKPFLRNELTDLVRSVLYKSRDKKS